MKRPLGALFLKDPAKFRQVGGRMPKGVSWTQWGCGKMVDRAAPRRMEILEWIIIVLIAVATA